MTVCSPWASESDIDACDDERFGDIDLYVLSDALDDASELLYQWSSRQWPGECEGVIRPCAKPQGGLPSWERAGASGGSVYARSPIYGCGCHRLASRSCRCGGVSEVRLPGVGPHTITEVLVDGAVLDVGEGFGYRIDDGNMLVRLPNEGETSARSWPCCQTLRLPDTAEGTWSVAFTWGEGPPSHGVRAAAELAGELALARCGGECRLPANVARLSREGVDIQLVQPDAETRDQLPQSVRFFLDAVAPDGPKTGPASVWSPDLPRVVFTDT